MAGHLNNYVVPAHYCYHYKKYANYWLGRSYRAYFSWLSLLAAALGSRFVLDWLHYTSMAHEI